MINALNFSISEVIALPIRIPNQLPAYHTLTGENIFVMTQTRAVTQDIRPLQILLLNLMPTKIDTETQLSRLLGNTPLQIELNLIATRSHAAHHTPRAHMQAFYQHFDDVCDRNFDGMVITGAPVEQLPFEQVDYWPELCRIMDWSRTHVHSTFHICWAAQAGLYHHFGVPKRPLPQKLCGVYPHRVVHKNSILFRGFDDVFQVPHSRCTTVLRADIERVPALKILAESPEAGVYAASTNGGRQIFVTGHSEYDADTLANEYRRDCGRGLHPALPAHYFPHDDPAQEPPVTWRSSANLLFSNWLNYFVYQTTPFDLAAIGAAQPEAPSF